MGSPCESCHAGCCRSFAAPISGADIIKIEQSYDLSFWDFACRWADPQGTIAKNVAPHFHFSDDLDTPFVICLAHETSQQFPGTTKCGFLVEGEADASHEIGKAHCRVYENRPMTCRNFPMKLNETGDLAILYDVPKPGRDGGHRAYDLCPEPLQPSDFDPIQSVQELVISKYEMQFFQQVADIWNRTPGEWKIFPDFLHLVYAERIGVSETRSTTIAMPAETEPVASEPATPELVQLEIPKDEPVILSFPGPSREADFETKRAA